VWRGAAKGKRWLLAVAVQPSNPSLDAPGRIDEDILCVQCGYNLRTLRMNAVASVRIGQAGTACYDRYNEV
jgi:hypothetical protein